MADTSTTLTVSTQTNTLNVPPPAPLKSGISQYFHGTRKYGSFSKSTIKKKKDSSSPSFGDNIMVESSNLCTLRSICTFFNFLPILHPVGPLKCFWDGMVMIMLIYTMIEIPYTLAFDLTLRLTPNDAFGIIAFCIDVCLCIDIMFNLRTAYFDKFDHLKLIINPIIIAKRYLRGWFIIDVLTSIPIEFMIPPTATQHNVGTYIKILRIFRVIRVIKILRLLKMVKLFDGVMRRIVVREMLIAVRLLKIVSVMLIYAHWSACLWYYIGCVSHKRYAISWLSQHTDLVHGCASLDVSPLTLSPVFTRYSYAWYWSVVTLFTTGYGDITAENIIEQWVASISILIGTCWFAYFIGTLTTLISEGDRISSEIMSKMEEAQHFCDKKKLPKEMARAVLTHTRYHCNYNYILDENSVLNNLPPYLQMDISLYISKTLMLQNIDFFDEEILDPVVRGSIAIKMRSISCNNGYQLYKKGDLAKEIYIQRTGKSIHLIQTKQGKKKRIQLNRGDVFGEYSLIKKKRESTVVCATWCEFYIIEINEIIDTLQQHYGNRWETKWAKMRRFVKMEYNKPLSWRKKRHLILKRHVTPSFNEHDSTSKQIEDEEGMHVVWTHSPNKASIRSTIRSEGLSDSVMFQHILNDQQSTEHALSVVSAFPDGSFIGKYNDLSKPQASVAEEKEDDDDGDMNIDDLKLATTHSEKTQLAQLENITNSKASSVDDIGDAYDHSIGRMNTTSTIVEIRQEKSEKEKTQHSMLNQMKAKSVDTEPEPSITNTKSNRRSTLKWLDSLRKTDTHTPKFTERNSSKKKGHKKKRKSLWFGSMRQNSELRDQAVVAANSVNIDVLREIFSDYHSESEGDIFNIMRAKSEHHIRSEGIHHSDNDLDLITASEPVITIVKQRSQSLGGDKVISKIRAIQHTERHSVNDMTEMVYINHGDDSMESCNTDSISIGDDLNGFESSNTFESEPKQTINTNTSNRANTANTITKKQKHGKFGGKKHIKKVGNKVNKNVMLNMKDIDTNRKRNKKEQMGDNDLPNTSLGSGLVSLSNIEENELINKSFVALKLRKKENDDTDDTADDSDMDENTFVETQLSWIHENEQTIEEFRE